MTRVLVTGGCGFVGVPVVRQLLASGHDVVVIDDLSRGHLEALGEDSESVRLVKGDVRDEHLVRTTCDEYGVNLVIHLAALHFIPHCDADPERCLSINVDGTQSVVDGALPAASVEGLVFASSAAVYAPDDAPHRESSRLAPTDVYGMSKLAGEQLVRRGGKRHDVPVGIARLFNVYGPGETNLHLVPAIIEQAERGERLYLGNVDTARDYIFTDDVARGLVALLGATAAGNSLTCNLGTGESYRGDQMVEAISEVMGVRLVVDTDPARVRPSDRPQLQAHIGYATEVLEWAPHTPLATGLSAARRELMQ